MLRGVVVVGAVCTAIACSAGEHLTAASAADPVLAVRDLRTGQPVTGVSGEVPGVGTYGAASDGLLRLPDQAVGRPVLLRAPGYVNARVVRYLPGAQEYLLPEDGRLPFDTVLAGVYRGDQEKGHLYKTRATRITVFPDASFRENRAAREAISHLIAEMARIRSVIQVVDRPGATPFPEFVLAQSDQDEAEFRLRLVLDPRNEWFGRPGYENTGALAINEYQGFTVVGSSLVFKGLDEVFFGEHLKRAVLHEGIHALGIFHLPAGVEGVMGQGMHLRPVAAELDLLVLLLVRPAGTKPVDDSTDPGVGAAAAHATRVVCAFP